MFCYSVLDPPFLVFCVVGVDPFRGFADEGGFELGLLILKPAERQRERRSQLPRAVSEKTKKGNRANAPEHQATPSTSSNFPPSLPSARSSVPFPSPAPRPAPRPLPRSPPPKPPAPPSPLSSSSFSPSQRGNATRGHRGWLLVQDVGWCKRYRRARGGELGGCRCVDYWPLARKRRARRGRKREKKDEPSYTSHLPNLTSHTTPLLLYFHAQSQTPNPRGGRR